MTQPSIVQDEKVNDLSLNDDSFDDEFRLLETTLTDFKENNSKIEGDSKNETLTTNDSGIFSLNLVEFTPKESLKSFTRDVTIPQIVPNNVVLPIEIISSTNFKSSPSFDIGLPFENLDDVKIAHSSLLPSTQHFKPTVKCNESLTNPSLVSSSENINFKCVTQHSVSNCDVSRIMQSSGNPVSSAVEENTDNNHGETIRPNCYLSVVNVAPCDSSFVENQEKTRPIHVSTVKSLQSIAEVQLNVCKKVLSGKQDCPELNRPTQEPENFESNEADITNADPVSSFKTAPALEMENKNLGQNQIFKMSQISKNKISGDTISENNSFNDLKQNYIMAQSTECKEAIMLCPTVKTSSDRLAGSTDNNLEELEICKLLPLNTKSEDGEISTCRTDTCSFEDDGKIKDEQIASSSDKKEAATLFCSTPIVNTILKEKVEDSIELNSDHMSPLNRPTNYLTSRMNLKRTNLCLERIEEVDESTDGFSDKRLKLGSPTFENKIVLEKKNENVSSSMSCFEPPAKSILKKWDPGCLSRDSFLILDECGETDSEETIKPRQESVDHTSVTLDDFEVACKSLAEELLMSSSNYETLEKYYSQVQLDSQMDDKKFDEVLQELTLNYEMDEKSFMSKMKPIEDNKFLSRENVTNYSHLNMEESLNDAENKENPLTPGHESGLSEDKKSLVEVKVLSSVSGADNVSFIKHEDNPETSSSTQQTKLICENERLVTIKGTDEKLSMDEEDVLLEEDIKVEQKQYVYFEYVSSDPKENEDNYNPEWQKLGKLTCDEERYKAVRDRWRSLVPPDPNRDLTCRQWRKKNNKPPLNIPSLNNNRQMFDGNEKNQLCTAVFEKKIANLLQDLQMRRMQIIKERNMNFETLAVDQDKQQRRVLLRGTNVFEMGMLQKRHIQECVMLKNRFDMQIDQITKTTEQKVMALKEACDEVMSFQKFYKGVGATDEEVCMYMTDIQVEELMETEEMLERYSQYYQ